jgi:hypothetical protein
LQNTVKRQIIKLITLVIICAVSVLLIIILPKSKTVTYDCRLSEISPDYPVEVKEQCRKLRMDKSLIRI